jgi:hypothetical protein
MSAANARSDGRCIHRSYGFPERLAHSLSVAELIGNRSIRQTLRLRQIRLEALKRVIRLLPSAKLNFTGQPLPNAY